MVTITQEEFDQLQLTEKRFYWLLRIWANVTGDRQADVIHKLDEMRIGRADLANWNRRMMPVSMPLNTRRQAYGPRPKPINLAPNGENS